MRLGAYPALLTPGSRVAEIYRAEMISERHRHRYEVNVGYKERLEATGLQFSGMSPDGMLPEIVEIPITPGILACNSTRNSNPSPSSPIRCSPPSSAPRSISPAWCEAIVYCERSEAIYDGIASSPMAPRNDN